MSKLDAILNWCEAQVGYSEGSNNYNKYAPLVTQAIGWDAQNQPWCSIFVLAAFIECFGIEDACQMLCTQVGQASAACAINAAAFSVANRYYGTPEVGDQIFFYVNGGINHTGIVVAVDSVTVTTIEGNSSDKVSKNKYNLGDSKIAGYGRPNWSLSEISDPFNTPITHGIQHMTTSMPLLTVELEPYSLDCVVAFQVLCNLRFNCGLALDGRYGDACKQACLIAQREYGLLQDGECGKDTWYALVHNKKS